MGLWVTVRYRRGCCVAGRDDKTAITDGEIGLGVRFRARFGVRIKVQVQIQVQVQG